MIWFSIEECYLYLRILKINFKRNYPFLKYNIIYFVLEWNNKDESLYWLYLANCNVTQSKFWPAFLTCYSPVAQIQANMHWEIKTRGKTNLLNGNKCTFNPRRKKLGIQNLLTTGKKNGMYHFQKMRNNLVG